MLFIFVAIALTGTVLGSLAGYFGGKVDLVFLLLSPPDAGAEHLKALAAVSRVTRHQPTLEKMRGARSRDALAAVLLGADERDAA